MKICIACGMPIGSRDYPLQDESKDYCKYCARPDGTMQSYPEKVEGTTEFLIRTQGLDAQAAREAAIRMLAKLPHGRGLYLTYKRHKLRRFFHGKQPGFCTIRLRPDQGYGRYPL
jgi:hypothetical protein